MAGHDSNHTSDDEGTATPPSSPDSAIDPVTPEYTDVMEGLDLEASDRQRRRRRRWILVAGTALAAGLLAFLASNELRTPMYGAEARVQIGDAEPTVPPEAVLTEVRAEYGRDTDPIVSAAVANLRVTPEPDGILIIHTRAPEPALAADLVNIVAEAYVALPVVESDAEMDRVSLDAARAELALVQTALEEARTSLTETSNRWQAVQTMATAQLGPYSSALRGNLERMAELRQTLAELEATFTPAHNLVRETQAEIQELEATIDGQGTAVRNTIQTSWENALSLEASLQTEYDAQMAEVSRQEAGQRNQPTAYATVVTSATARTEPIEPAHAVTFGAGALVGLLLSLAFLLIQGRAGRRLEDPNAHVLALNVNERTVAPSPQPVATSKPALEPEPIKPGPKPQAKPEVSEAQKVIHERLDSLMSNTQRRQRVELETWYRRQSPIAKSVRSFADGLMAGQEQDTGRVLVVSSPGPSEGKTTITCNLGIAMADAGQRVLLVDGNLTNPKLNEIFKVDQTLGLGGILDGPVDVPNIAIESQILRTQIPGLYVLPSGRGAPYPTGSEGEANVSKRVSERLESLVARLRSHFDVTLIDTPSLADRPDARILAQRTDGMVLVLRSGASSIDSTSIERERLKEAGIRLMGTILNDTESTPTTGAPGPRPSSDPEVQVS